MIRIAARRLAGENELIVHPILGDARRQAVWNMKLVTLYIDSGDAAEANSRLRQAGVMTRLSVVDPHNIKPSKSGAERIALSVVFDDQFDDAVRLLENPRHVPRRKISIAEMNEIESTGRAGLFKPAVWLKEKATLAVLTVCLLGLIAYSIISLFI